MYLVITVRSRFRFWIKKRKYPEKLKLSTQSLTSQIKNELDFEVFRKELCQIAITKCCTVLLSLSIPSFYSGCLATTSHVLSDQCKDFSIPSFYSGCLATTSHVLSDQCKDFSIPSFYSGCLATWTHLTSCRISG